MRLVITGGAGFLGYHLSRRLSDKYAEIIIADIVPPEPSEYPKNAKYINADVRDHAQLARIFKGADAIVHAAAALPLWRKQDIFDINVGGTVNALEAAKSNNIRRLVYISSTAVYGVPKKHPLYEDDPLIGVGPYGESKIAAEKICVAKRKEGMCVTVIRPKTFIGMARLGVFQILYDWVESGRRIPVIGNGKNRYQLLEVEDLAEAIYLLLSAPEMKANDTFNIGAEEFATVAEDVGALCAYAKTGARVMVTPAGLVIPVLILLEKLKLSPLYKWVYGTAGRDSYVSIEKLKRVLGWAPKYSNAQALIRAYEWYLEHKAELSGTGITHRVAWKQGALGLIKRFF